MPAVMRRAFWLLAILAMPAVAQEWAGIVKSVRGEVVAERAGKTQPLAVGDRVYPRDKLVTGKDSQVGVTLRDDTLISAGANSQLLVAEFAFDPATQNGNVLLSVVRGVTAMVSGLVAKSNPAAMRVTTPTATLGIRGTEFIVEVDARED
jgi:hypothetical protein